MRLPSFPKFRRRVFERQIPVGTRLLRVGEDLRTQLSEGPLDASPAERAVYGWLVRFDVPFAFQIPLMGGRRIPGGAVVDFIVYLENPPLVIRVMSYWHMREDEIQVDKTQKELLESEGFRVEDIWEWETVDWHSLSAKLEEILFGNRAVYAMPFMKPPYVSPQPDCLYDYNDMCFGVDC